MIHVWYLIWLWFPIPDGFEKYFPSPISPNLMCASHHMSTLSRMDGLCFPKFEPWSHSQIKLKQKNWTCPHPHQCLKKKLDFMVLLFGVVFSKEPFYWLLQYLGHTQSIVYIYIHGVKFMQGRHVLCNHIPRWTLCWCRVSWAKVAGRDTFWWQPTAL